MSIILFAIIGATIKAGVGYWVFFYLLCSWKLARIVGYICKDKNENKIN